MRGINCTEVIGYVTEGEYQCARHEGDVDPNDTDTGYTTAVFAGDEGSDDLHCRLCFEEEQRAAEALHNVPNLDCMPREELWAFWKRYARPSRKDAEALIGDRRKGYTTLCGALAGYASNKATAMRCREEGDINGAQVYETIADRIYAKLPPDLQW